uniref:Nucleoporin Nup120/160 n=1 Tax=Coccidioides posadasii RMSCC 3488 TaxID=454284 RepID=A0A0J6II72_COCPO|nr:hypothetical protein CPAG_07869 [Coccidioides posadasii RMSCC 3488]
MLKLFKEAKVIIRPNTSIVNISIPSPQHTHGRIEVSTQDPSSRAQVAQVGDTFANELLATQASVYCRKHKCYPRSILWRVIGADRILEIRSVDLIKNIHDHQEAVNTLRLEFPDTIIPHGVAFADGDDHHGFNIFVITASKQLYTIDIRSQFFLSQSQIDRNVAKWCKSCRPAPLNFVQPHRLYAGSRLELFISINTGSLLRLTRNSEDDGSGWSLLTLDERSWGASLRGLVNWGNSNSIQYNGKSLDPNTPNAISTTPDQAFAFVVSLNHSIKAWNLASHRLVASKDLLNRTSRQRDVHPITLSPAECTFIKIFTAERALPGGMYYMITYSPYDEGQFKFWVLKGSLTGQLDIEDLFPDIKLQAVDPEPPGSLFWNIVDFEIASTDDGRNMVLWVLWRSSTFYQLYSIQFDLLDLPNAWRKNWTKMALELHHDLPPTLSHPCTTDVTSEWLEFIFFPGRYPPQVMETALSIFLQSVRAGVGRGFQGEPENLQERIYRAIRDSVALCKSSDAIIDYSQYFNDLDTAWRQFWLLVDEINKKRFQPISFAFDFNSNLPWIIFSDSCASVRECTSTEIILHNESDLLRNNLHHAKTIWPHRNLVFELGDHPDQSAKIIGLAASFRNRLTQELIQNCHTTLNTELVMEPSLSALERVTAFHDRCGFAYLLTDSMYDAIHEDIENSIGFDRLRTDSFLAIINTIPSGFQSTDSGYLSTEFGRDAIMTGATESICLTKQIVFDLLLLIVFIEIELRPEAIAEFSGPELFDALVGLLKEYEILSWLVSRVRVSQRNRSIDHGRDAKTRIAANVQLAPACERRISILEEIFAVHTRLLTGSTSLMHSLTQQVCTIVSWTMSTGRVSFEHILVFIQCGLLVDGNIDLATDFLCCQPDTGWSTYVKGRLCLAKCDFDGAVGNFQKASHILSYGRPIGDLHEMSAKLVDMTSVANFHSGLSNYFLHITGLFERAQSFISAAFFTSLSLEFAEYNRASTQPASNLRAELPSRLFHSYLKTYHFDGVYIALSRDPDPAFRPSALTSLLTSVFLACGTTTRGLKRMLRLPLSLEPGAYCRLDDILASITKKRGLPDFLPNELGLSAGSIDYLSTLKAFYIARNDLLAAASVSYQMLCLLRNTDDGVSEMTYAARTKTKNNKDATFAQSTQILGELLSLTNLLASIKSSEAYILVDPMSLPSARSNSIPTTQEGVSMMDPTPTDQLAMRQHSVTTQIVLTVNDLRREYQLELDKILKIQSGDWEYGEF